LPPNVFHVFNKVGVGSVVESEKRGWRAGDFRKVEIGLEK
jgi:hypothetical protein